MRIFCTRIHGIVSEIRTKVQRFDLGYFVSQAQREERGERERERSVCVCVTESECESVCEYKSVKVSVSGWSREKNGETMIIHELSHAQQARFI